MKSALAWSVPVVFNAVLTFDQLEGRLIKAIAFMLYETIKGRKIELDALTPLEQGLLWGQLEWIGVPKLLFLRLDDPDKELSSTEKERLPDQTLFLETWNMLLRNRVSKADRDQIQNGPLALIIDDVVLRLGIIKQGWKKDFLQHDPRWFLSDFRKQHKTLAEFAQCVGIDDVGQASRALAALQEDAKRKPDDLSEKTHLSIPGLRRAASKMGITFDFIKQDSAANAQPFITCRDYSQQALGTRIGLLTQVLARLKFNRDDIASFLFLEFKARAGEPADAINPLLSLVEAYQGFAKHDDRREEKICTFEIDDVDAQKLKFEDFASKYAWIFFGMEFHWFEQNGWIPIILDGEALGNFDKAATPGSFTRCGISPALPEQPTGREKRPDQQELERQARVCHYEYVESVLYRNWKPISDTSRNSTTADQELQNLVNLFSERTRLLLASDALAWLTVPLLSRWYYAFTSHVCTFENLGILQHVRNALSNPANARQVYLRFCLKSSPVSTHESAGAAISAVRSADNVLSYTPRCHVLEQAA